MAASTVQLFVSIGLSEDKAKDTLKNEAITRNLKLAIDESKKLFSHEIPRQVGVFLYHIATKIKPKIAHFVPLLVQYVSRNQIYTDYRLQAAIDYLLEHPKEPVDIKAFEEACGVGIIVTPEQVEQVVEELVVKHKDALLKQRYRFNCATLIGDARRKLKFADGRDIKNEIEVQLLDLLGPKTPEDSERPKATKAKSVNTVNVTNKNSFEEQSPLSQFQSGAMTIGELMKNKVHFHKPGENHKTEDYVVTPNTQKLLEKHLAETGGKVITRFPPEPNGILHIGHAKAININFGYAMVHDGICVLRYDDTNPEKEEAVFFEGIRNMVEWLGYKPSLITHSSDYFDQLYEWAKELIRRGHGYVCHQPADALKGHNAPPSPWRDRPTEESLQLFEDMKNGKIDEGKATLRMKMTMEEGKQDPVAYRIKFLPHPRTGEKWCIYPTYDYAHCLCDSIENITHSLCTREFRTRRSSYYWLCNVLDLYCPVQWEYGRLKMDYTIVSKRKIGKLISENIVKDWDDPRLFTLTALRRRGFPPEAINNFCAMIGVSSANSVVEPCMLEFCVREVLQVTAPRTMVVLNPLKITITNFPSDFPSQIVVPDFPNEAHRGSHKVAISNVIYIEQSDYREKSDKSYRRLANDQHVGLRYAGLVLYVEKAIKDSNDEISELEVTCRKINDSEKPKAFIHWVSSPITCEVRMYEKLFHHKNPEDSAEVPGGFISDCNVNALSISKALADSHLKNVKALDRFQFERIGYFAVDPDTTDNLIVFNRTLQMKEDANKN